MKSPIIINSKNEIVVAPDKLTFSMKRLVELASKIADAFNQGKTNE